jgi:NADPH:quinone reductase-like Zn-dependent oxidoreductase
MPMTETYRAVEYAEYGGPEVLRVVERDAPEPGPDQVRVAIRAAGLNPIDWKLRSGEMAEVMPARFPVVPGVDMAGMVDRVGPGVTEFAVGDEVLGKGSGTYAELTLASTEGITAKPPEVSWEVAAGLPVVATTTYRVLALLGVKPGETLLIDGAAGGVGTIAVQVARQRGVEVIGTASPANHDYLSSLGAKPVSYGEGLAERVRAVSPGGVDAALDASGRGSLRALVDLVGGPERVVTIADGSAAELGVRFTSGGPDEVPGSLTDAVSLVAAGEITLPIARVYSLDDAADAQRDSEAGHVRGKLILVPR